MLWIGGPDGERRDEVRGGLQLKSGDAGRTLYYVSGRLDFIIKSPGGLSSLFS